jgi:hypothetical protein
MSGKGSSPRPFSVSNEEYANRWDAIFQRDKKEIEDEQAEIEEFEFARRMQEQRNINTGTNKNEYYDVLTTEEALTKLVEENERLGLYDVYNKP